MTLTLLRREAARWDPVVFARQCGKEPDPWQEDVLIGEHDRLILNCSRQSGKTTVVALRALHTALYRDGSLVLILSATMRQSGRMLRVVRDLYDSGGRAVRLNAESQLQMSFANGSEIIALPGKPGTVRGYAAVTLLIVDEAGDVSDSLFHAVYPMLSVSKGDMVILGTPRGTRGHFHGLWSAQGKLPEAERRWHMVEVPWSKCPRITAEDVEEARLDPSRGDAYVAEEFECRFLDAERRAFRQEDIDAALVPGIETWDDLRFGVA